MNEDAEHGGMEGLTGLFNDQCIGDFGACSSSDNFGLYNKLP